MLFLNFATNRVLPALAAALCGLSGAAAAMPGIKTPPAAEVRVEADCAGAQDEVFMKKGFGVCRLIARLSIDGRTAEGLPVVWEVRKVENHGAVAPGFEALPVGFAWGAPVAGRSSPVEGLWTAADKTGAASASLADVVGERDAVVCAAVMGSVRGSGCASVHFGKGPLSRFLQPSAATMVRAQHAKRCEAQGGAEPTVDDLQSVSLKGRFNARSDAWGAAIAAGWRWDVRYWAELSAYSPGRSRETNLTDGHFHGGNAALDDLRYSACLRRE